jgi:uncharacterized lipoprotein YajG
MKHNSESLGGLLASFGKLAVFSCVVAAAGCTHTYSPSASSRMEALSAEFTGSGDIVLKNAQPSDQAVVFMKNMGSKFTTSLRACTDVAITIARRELVARGVRVDSDARRTLSLSVESLETQVGAVKIETQLVLRVTTGDGYTTKYVAENDSQMMANIPRQCNGAIMRGVKEMLSDPKVVEYLTRK